MTAALLVIAARVAESTIETLIVGVLVILALAALVYFGCRAAGRPTWGQNGAAGVFLLGAILLVLLLL